MIKLRKKLQVFRAMKEAIDNVEPTLPTSYMDNQARVLAFACAWHKRLGDKSPLSQLPVEFAKIISGLLQEGQPPLLTIFGDLGNSNFGIPRRNKIAAHVLAMNRLGCVRVHPCPERSIAGIQHCLFHSGAEMHDCAVLPLHFLNLPSLIVFSTEDIWQRFCLLVQSKFSRKQANNKVCFFNAAALTLNCIWFEFEASA